MEQSEITWIDASKGNKYKLTFNKVDMAKDKWAKNQNRTVSDHNLRFTDWIDKIRKRNAFEWNNQWIVCIC